MVSVKLAKYWSPEEQVLAPGTVVDVDEATAKWLDRCGAVAHDKPSKVKKSESVEPEPEAASVQPEEADEDTEVTRPANAASIEAWRRFAEAQGIVTKGLSKKELIAATR